MAVRQLFLLAREHKERRDANPATCAFFHRAKTATRVANIPADQFEALVESDAAPHPAPARTSGEVLEARDLASVADDAAKTAARLARAKQAHDTVVAEIHRAQAAALTARARAEIRLAEEYDAAQERGEVAGHGRSKVEPDNVTTAADLGLRRDEIHEARRLRDAEAATVLASSARSRQAIEADLGRAVRKGWLDQ